MPRFTAMRKRLENQYGAAWKDKEREQQISPTATVPYFNVS